MKYAGVIVDISHEKLDKTFCYSIPAELESFVEIGSNVRIPFGRSHRTGYVVELTDSPEIDSSMIKDIEGIVPKSVSVNENFIKLAYWIKTNYGSTIFRALKTVIPVKEAVKADSRKTVLLQIEISKAHEIALEYYKKNKAAQARILDALSESPVSEYGLITKKLNVSAPSIKSLEKQGLIKIDEYTVFRNAINVKSNNKTSIVLNEEQNKVASSIKQEYDNHDMSTCLIKGITGSGKTEVYMDIIEHVIEKGKEVIFLIPEISLTYQMVMRFYNRFGELVSIINSRLSKGEKYDRFQMAAEGKIKIMIGPRSALFTPFNNLGLIIIDEEHENAYQSEQVPKYHARETAIELARITGAKVILGSATPSLESYYRAENGIYKLYTLESRAGKASLPNTEIIDLRNELKSGNRRMCSRRLQELIADRLSKKEQIMLFLNRRGYQGFVTCLDCGHVIKCPHCEVSLTMHNNSRMICHYCGYETGLENKCSECGSSHVKRFKAGTQKIEEEINLLFPEAVTLRMDKDTTSGKDGHARILEQFSDGKADILIGTQMIAKGHDFSKVTLVGVLLADTSLHSPDYKASETTFDLLTQVSGRAGRGDIPGSVVIQTYDPDNYSIVYGAKQDYNGFYDEEISYRRLLNYPPVFSMLSVRIFSQNEKKAIDNSFLLKKETEGCKDVISIGPSNASIYKINDIFYRVIYYKCASNNLLIAIKDRIEEYINNNQDKFKDCQVQFDFR